MRLTVLDWSIVAAYFAFNLAVGFYYKSRAGKSTGEFFLGGRNVPWWLAGTSMVATIDVPASHHGTLRPPRKNSPVLLLARDL